MSGFFNTGVPNSLLPNLFGAVSGLLNTGAFTSGLFSLSSLLAGLA
jgi:hypothetical protein